MTPPCDLPAAPDPAEDRCECSACKLMAPAWSMNLSGRCSLCEPLNDEQQAYQDELVAKTQAEGVAFMRSRGVMV